MLYPLPAILLTTRNKEGRDNVCTVAWAGTVCTNPPMLSVSLRPSRLSCEYLSETGVFGVNLTTEALAEATDFCGVRSGRDVDKFEFCHFHKEEAAEIPCALIAESPVSIECRVKETLPLGSHTMFVAEVLAVHADTKYLGENGAFDLDLADPIVYSHGVYRGLGKKLGTFGYSVKKAKRKKTTGKNNKITEK